MAEINPHNPWDQTIWDPNNPEQAIEDPFHGPSAIHDMLQNPAMPMGDGTYYQTGAYYSTGTAHVDYKHRPVYRIGRLGAGMFRESNDLMEWLTVYAEGGDEALIELEAERQRKRLDERGVAYAYKPTDVCPGGEQIAECATVIDALDVANEFAAGISKERPGEGQLTQVPRGLAKKCIECSVYCDAAVKTIDGVVDTTFARFAKLLPEADIMLHIELPKPEQIDSKITLEQLDNALSVLHDSDRHDESVSKDKAQKACDLYKRVNDNISPPDSSDE